VALEIDRAALATVTLCAMVRLVQTIGPLGFSTKIAELSVGVIRIVDRQPGGMNRVDRYVNMQHVGITMHHADTLMLIEAKASTEIMLDLSNRRTINSLAGSKRQKQVEGLVTGCTSVQLLSSNHLVNG